MRLTKPGTVGRADVLQGLAGLALALGDPAGAARYAEDARRIRSTLGQGGSWKAADDLLILSQARHQQGRMAEAEKLYRETSGMQTAGGVKGTLAWIERRNALAEFLHETGRTSEAHRLSLDNVSLINSTFGRSPMGAMALNDLALSESRRREFDQAMKHYAEALAILRERFPAGEHVFIALTLNNIGECLNLQGRDAEALAPYTEALRIRERLLPRGHNDIAISLNNLGVSLAALDRPLEAIQAYRRALPITRSTLGERHPDYALLLGNLGKAYMDLDQYPEAEPLLREAMSRDRANRYLPKRDLAVTVLNVARIGIRTGKAPEAEKLAREAIALLGADGLPRSTERVGDAYIVLTIALYKQNRFREALAAAEDQRPHTAGDEGVTHDLDALIVRAREKVRASA